MTRELSQHSNADSTSWWKPLTLDRSWDMRWNAEAAEEAVMRADDQAREARRNLDAAIRCVTRATEQYAEAMQWTSSARRFAERFAPTIPDPPAVALGREDAR